MQPMKKTRLTQDSRAASTMPPTTALWYSPSSQSVRTPNVGARVNCCDAPGTITSPSLLPLVLGATVGGTLLPRLVVQRRRCIQLRAWDGCGSPVENPRHDAAIVTTYQRTWARP